MATFPGFPADTLDFLTELRDHNDRDWFKARQARYEASVREPARAFVRALAPRLAALAPHLVADDRKVGGSLMRIHRDTRFSKDKTPYKTNVALHFRHDAGKDVHAPGLYVHLEPDNVFVAGGMWLPDRDSLAAIRDAIATHGDAWLAAVALPRGYERSGEQLKRGPAGTDLDHPMIDELKYKSFLIVRELAPDAAERDDFLDEVCASLTAFTPMFRFLCTAIGQPF